MNSQKRLPSSVGALVHELETLFAKLRRLEREGNASEMETTRIALATFKRGMVERLDRLMPAISNVVLDGSLQDPAILDEFERLRFSVPDPRQTSLTWAPYLARLRQVLLLALGAGVSNASATGKVNGHPERSGAIRMNDVEPERASLGSGPSGAAVQLAKETFTCKELAQRWSLGQSTIRRIFRDEPGVLRIPHSRRRGKRDYISLRIPAAVAARVRSRLSRPLFKVE